MTVIRRLGTVGPCPGRRVLRKEKKSPRREPQDPKRRHDYASFEEIAEIKLLLHMQIPKKLLARAFGRGHMFIVHVSQFKIHKEIAMSARPGFEVVLDRLRKFVSAGRAGLFDAVTLAVRLWEDAEFTAASKSNGGAAAVLSKELDYGVPFPVLRDILEHYPMKKQWRDGSLSEMASAVHKAQRQADQSRKKPRTREVITHAQYDKLEAENKLLRQRVADLESQVATLNELVATYKNQPRIAPSTRKRKTA